MDIYLTLLETGDCFCFPLLPEEIKTSMGNQFASYNTLGTGEIRIPSGISLDSVSWSGLFPGKTRESATYIRQWSDPQECYKWLENAKSKAGTSKKLRLLITETTINLDVYLDQLTGNYMGGQGDFYYNLSFVQAKDLIVSSWSPSADSTDSSSDTTTEESVTDARPEPPQSTTYTVVKGDSLWAIAQRFMGSGSRYPELYAANQSTIDGRNAGTGNSKYTIYSGQVFTIPS